MYKISWKPKAVRQLGKIRDLKVQEAIFEAVDDLTHFPKCKNLKQLVNHDYGYRLRVGHYRVLLDIYTEIRIVEVTEVKKRDEHTY